MGGFRFSVDDRILHAKLRSEVYDQAFAEKFLSIRAEHYTHLAVGFHKKMRTFFFKLNKIALIWDNFVHIGLRLNSSKTESILFRKRTVKSIGEFKITLSSRPLNTARNFRTIFTATKLMWKIGVKRTIGKSKIILRRLPDLPLHLSLYNIILSMSNRFRHNSFTIPSPTFGITILYWRNLPPKSMWTDLYRMYKLPQCRLLLKRLWNHVIRPL